VPRRVALARPLELDHFGAHVGQDHRAVRTSHVLGEVQDADALEGTPARIGHRVSPCGRRAEGRRMAGTVGPAWTAGPERGTGRRADWGWLAKAGVPSLRPRA